MISQDAIEKILGFGIHTETRPKVMAEGLTLTFFPYEEKLISSQVHNFSILLKKNLLDLGVKIISYEDALEIVPVSKIVKRFIKICVNNFLFVFSEIFKFRHNYHHIHPGALRNLLKTKRIKKGISVIALGSNEKNALPIDYSSSFVSTSIITVVDCPENVEESSDFSVHFDTAMNHFAYHMTHLVIVVKNSKWGLYNFNASHPFFDIKEDMKSDLLKSLVPKIAAPIRPPVLKDFIVSQHSFSITDHPYKSMVEDLQNGSRLFEITNLYPKGKKINELPFRNGFYRWIGKIHLDHRSGMSYGFLAKQVPSIVEPMFSISEFKNVTKESNCFYVDGQLFVVIEIGEEKFAMRVPDVWVITQRSGSNKTNIDPENDLLLIGLVNGKMYLKTPQGSKLRSDYKPSFDTRVILAHAVGNAMVASISKKLSINSDYVKNFSENGLALAHWHGYIRNDLIPKNLTMYGKDNPHVACSTPQSAIFALADKLAAFNEFVKSGKQYNGDIHIEPHHGINVTFPSLVNLAEFLLETQSSELGNKYLPS